MKVLGQRLVACQQGAVLVQASLILVLLLGFCAFVVDFGVLWMSRGQAQNAADAGAMSGAIARAYDADDVNPGGSVEQSAAAVVAANPVWFDAPASTVSFQCPSGSPAWRCVRVEVYRDGTNSSEALPMIFGPVINVTTQGVRATATAQVAPGNATTCMKPLAIPDTWIEGTLPGNQFNKYVESGPDRGDVLLMHDDYVAPDSGDAGSGLTFPADLGLAVTLSFLNPTGGTPAIVTGSLLPLVLPGANTYLQNISDCNGRLATIGQFIPTGSNGDSSDTSVGFSNLMTSDSGASWNSSLNNVEGSCAPTCAPVSPRLFAIAVFDVDAYQYNRIMDSWPGCPNGQPCVKVVNIVGFFLTSSSGDGYIARYPGLMVSPPSISTASSFLPAVTLIR